MSDRHEERVVASRYLFLGLSVIGLALVAAAFISAEAFREAKRAGETITVTGSAKRPIRSDFIVWRGSVAAQGSTLAPAYEEVTRHTTRVRAYLAKRGVPDAAVTFGSIQTEPLVEVLPDGAQTGRVVGYQLRQPFEVRSDQVDAIGALSREATELIREGVPLVSAPPEYLFTKLAEVRIQMLGEASKDAQARARTIAESVGNRIDKVKSARMGVFQVTPRNSTEVADYGINDTTSLEKDITGVVSVTFALE
jgi:hypothetical protein